MASIISINETSGTAPTTPTAITMGAVALGMCLLTNTAQAINAGADMKANELNNGAETNPNGVWSYGMRAAFAATDLTLLGTHTQDFLGDTNFPGWVGPYTSDNFPNPTVKVNMGPDGTTSGNWGGPGGPFLGGATPDMGVHPANGAQTENFVVVRWTAPAAGTYTVDAFWRDISNGGVAGSQGVDVHLVHNGVSLFDSIASLELGPATTATNQAVTVASGDFLDFVVGPNANGNTNGTAYYNDGTAFNVEIVPEPTSVALLALGSFGLLARRRRA